MKKWNRNFLRIISVFLTLVMVITFVGMGQVEVQAKQKQKKNVVVLYFSATGTTKGAAKKLGRRQKER